MPRKHWGHARQALTLCRYVEPLDRHVQAEVVGALHIKFLLDRWGILGVASNGVRGSGPPALAGTSAPALWGYFY
jgi:hypothetical protein